MRALHLIWCQLLSQIQNQNEESVIYCRGRDVLQFFSVEENSQPLRRFGYKYFLPNPLLFVVYPPLRCVVSDADSTIKLITHKQHKFLLLLWYTFAALIGCGVVTLYRCYHVFVCNVAPYSYQSYTDLSCTFTKQFPTLITLIFWVFIFHWFIIQNYIHQIPLTYTERFSEVKSRNMSMSNGKVALRPRNCNLMSGKGNTFFSKAFRPAVGPTQPTAQWVLQNDGGVKVITPM
jgi:hypothetical protein